MGCPSMPRVLYRPQSRCQSWTVPQPSRNCATARYTDAWRQHFGTERNATFRRCSASPLNGKQHVGTSGDFHRSCGRETDSLQHVRAVTDSPWHHQPKHSRATFGNRKTFSFITKKNLHDKPEGADLETLRRWRKENEMHKLCETVRYSRGGGFANRVMHFGISYRWENRLTSWTTISFSTSSVLCSTQITLRSAHQLQERNSNLRDQKVVCGVRKGLKNVILLC